MADEANKNLGRPQTEENLVNKDMFGPPPPKRKHIEVLPSENKLASKGGSVVATLAKEEGEGAAGSHHGYKQLTEAEYEKIFHLLNKEPGTLEVTRERFENAIKEAIRFKY